MYFLSFASLVALSASLPASPAGDTVFRFDVQNNVQLELLQSLLKNRTLELDSWTRPGISQNVDIRIPLKTLSTTDVMDQLSSIPHSVFIADVQALIQRERDHTESLKVAKSKQIGKSLAARPTEASIFSDYQDADTYMTFLLQQPGATEIKLGDTYEKRAIRGVKFGIGNHTIFFNGGVHAREWISPATATFVASFLMGNDPRAVDLRSKFTFHMSPVINMDGYAYSRNAKGNRMWRKNREPNSGSSCIGTDINRNFAFHWSENNGASSDECADDFYGSAPYSTHEARAMQDYLAKLPNLLSYMDLHSYSQLWLYPWGWSCDEKPAPDHADHDAASRQGAKALAAVRGTKYTVEQGCDLYVATGCNDENFYANLGVKYSMTIELPDTGRNGFLLPASEIVPVGKETVEGLIPFWSYAYLHQTLLYHN